MEVTEGRLTNLGMLRGRNSYGSEILMHGTQPKATKSRWSELGPETNR